MASLIPGYNYDIFISYRQKDNKHDGWVTEFVDNLKGELESAFKEEVSVYFDINPHDGLLETHDVDASLKDKLKCLIFIPIISRTYCDPKSFAWEHEFKAFVEQASQDQFGLKVKLLNGNVASRVLPVRIYDLDNVDTKLCESILGGMLRSIDFIYKSAGVNRPLSVSDSPDKNLNKTYYRDQINKVANSIKEIITAIGQHLPLKEEELPGQVFKPISIPVKNNKTKIIIGLVIVLAIVLLGYLFIPTFSKSKEQHEKSIAVLPFINDSPVDSNKYFINGIMDDILNDLQAIKDLKPISRTSAEKYRNTTKSIPEIAKELGVNYIVEGSGQRSGNKIRLNVHLFRAPKERPLWAKFYEQELHNATDIFKLQSQIAELIATEIKAMVTLKEKKLIEKIPTNNLAAYEDYLQGIFHSRKFTDYDTEIALKYFDQARKKDPEFAVVYAGISDVWVNRAIASFSSPDEATQRALAAIQKALELDSTRAEVYEALATIQTFIKKDWKGSESSVKKAIELKPNYADAQASYVNIMIISGRMKEAIEQAEFAIRLDPLNPMPTALYGLVLLFARRYDEAIMVFQEILKTTPTNELAIANLPEAFHLVGKYKEELEAWKTYYSNVFNNFIHVFDQGYAKGGLEGALNFEADTLVSQSRTKNINPFEIALIYACAGNRERTLEMLELAYKVNDPNAPFLTYPVFDIVRDEPRFQDLCRKMNLPYKLIE